MAPVALLPLPAPSAPLNCSQESPRIVPDELSFEPGDCRDGHAAERSSESVAKAGLEPWRWR